MPRGETFEGIMRRFRKDGRNCEFVRQSKFFNGNSSAVLLSQVYGRKRDWYQVDIPVTSRVF